MSISRFAPRLVPVVLALLVLAACGGGGGSGGVLPAGEIVFPLDGMSFEAATITVHGNGSSGADAVLVNGVAAQSGDAFASWSATIGLQPGRNTITATRIDAGRQRIMREIEVANQPEIFSYRNITDVVNDRFVAIDLVAEQFVLVDLAAATRVSVPVPASLSSQLLGGIHYDASRNRALVLGGDLHIVDFTARIVTTIGLAGTSAQSAFGLAHDPATERCFFVAPGNPQFSQFQRIVAYSIPGATFSLLSAAPAPADVLPGTGDLRRIDFDPVSGKLFVLDWFSASILAIEADGTRSPVSLQPAPSSPPLFVAHVLRVRPGGLEAVVHTSDPTMQVVDLVNGGRQTYVPGPPLGYARAGLDEAGRAIFGLEAGSSPNVEEVGLAAWDEVNDVVIPFATSTPVARPFPDALVSLQDFDSLRNELVFSTGSSLVRLQPESLALRHQHVTSPLGDPSDLHGLSYDAANDMLRGLAVPGAGAFEAVCSIDAETGALDTVPNFTATHVNHTSVAGREPVTGLWTYATADPFQPPSTLRIDVFDDQGAIAVTHALPSPGTFDNMVYDHLTNRILAYPHALSLSIPTTFAAVDPLSGALSLLSLPGTDGIDFFIVRDAATNPATGLYYLVASGLVVEIDPATGGRRIVWDADQQGLLYLSLPKLAVDPRCGVVYLGTGGSLIAIDPVTRAWAFVYR